jgi:hypothetical protein
VCRDQSRPEAIRFYDRAQKRPAVQGGQSCRRGQTQGGPASRDPPHQGPSAPRVVVRRWGGVVRARVEKVRIRGRGFCVVLTPTPNLSPQGGEEFCGACLAGKAIASALCRDHCNPLRRHPRARPEDPLGFNGRHRLLWVQRGRRSSGRAEDDRGRKGDDGRPWERECAVPGIGQSTCLFAACGKRGRAFRQQKGPGVARPLKF